MESNQGFHPTAEQPLRGGPRRAPDGTCAPASGAHTSRTHFLHTQSRQILTETTGRYGDQIWKLQPYRGCSENSKILAAGPPAGSFSDSTAPARRATRVVVNDASPELLQETLASRRWRPAPITFAGSSDCYQPIERQLRLTRRCLEVLAAARNPVVIHTTSALIVRDLDLLAGLARRRSAQVHLSLTTLDDELAERLEPGHTPPTARLAAIRRLADAGIPTSVVAAPILPGLNDSEIPAILGAAAQAGAHSAAWHLGGLPHDIDQEFWNWLETDRPMMQKKVAYGRQTRTLPPVRGRFARESRKTFAPEAPAGTRHFSSNAEGNVSATYLSQLEGLFTSSAKRYGLDQPLPLMDGAQFRRPVLSNPK